MYILYIYTHICVYVYIYNLYIIYIIYIDIYIYIYIYIYCRYLPLRTLLSIIQWNNRLILGWLEWMLIQRYHVSIESASRFHQAIVTRSVVTALQSLSWDKFNTKNGGTVSYIDIIKQWYLYNLRIWNVTLQNPIALDKLPNLLC